MNRTHVLVVAFGVVAVLWVGLSAQQEMLSRPGPGSGVMNVNVLNNPTVASAQAGQWVVTLGHIPDVKITNDVRIGNTPTVIVRGPNVGVSRGTFLVVWTNGETERLALEFEQDGWARVGGSGTRPVRWINLHNVRSIEEVK